MRRGVLLSKTLYGTGASAGVPSGRENRTGLRAGGRGVQVRRRSRSNQARVIFASGLLKGFYWEDSTGGNTGEKCGRDTIGEASHRLVSLELVYWGRL